MSRYERLTRYLEAKPIEVLPMTFGDIEDVIGVRLPPSAFRHRAWWSNNANNSAMTKAWLDAGWKSSDVDMEARKLVFRRFPVRPAKPANENLVVTGLETQTIQRLKLRAELSGRSFEELVRSVLIEGSHLTPQERDQLSARSLAQSPNLHHIDLVAMIREDRDSR